MCVFMKGEHVCGTFFCIAAGMTGANVRGRGRAALKNKHICFVLLAVCCIFAQKYAYYLTYTFLYTNKDKDNGI